jgi:hypothetical protein
MQDVRNAATRVAIAAALAYSGLAAAATGSTHGTVPKGLAGKYRLTETEQELLARGGVTRSDARSNAGTTIFALYGNGTFKTHFIPDFPAATAGCGGCVIDATGTYGIERGCLEFRGLKPIYYDMGCYQYTLFKDKLVLKGPVRPSATKFDTRFNKSVYASEPWIRIG